MIERKVLNDSYLEQGKSLQEIAADLKCSVNQVCYWMKRHGIARRTRSEAIYLKNNPDGDPFKVKEYFSNRDLFLLGIGLGLWWGEGYKRHKGAVRLGNTDPELIKTFQRFLTKICGVKKEKIRYGIQIFGDHDPIKVKNYWMRQLNASDDQFLPKVVVTRKRGKGTYKQKMKYGVLTLYCINIRLRKVMDDLMEKYVFSRKNLKIS